LSEYITGAHPPQSVDQTAIGGENPGIGVKDGMPLAVSARIFAAKAIISNPDWVVAG